LKIIREVFYQINTAGMQYRRQPGGFMAIYNNLELFKFQRFTP